MHYYGWDMGIVKLRKSLKIRKNIKSLQEVFDEGSDFEEVSERLGGNNRGGLVTWQSWLCVTKQQVGVSCYLQPPALR